jgi:hypothetical protein
MDQKTTAPRLYCSTYCNRGHVVRTGRPVGHECRVLPPAALAAEIAGDFAEAVRILETTPATFVRGR